MKRVDSDSEAKAIGEALNIISKARIARDAAFFACTNLIFLRYYISIPGARTRDFEEDFEMPGGVMIRFR